jgi:NADPH2:quinone reductase
LLFNDLTMYFALTVRGRLQSGETVLVHGAAGGIGTSTLHLAPDTLKGSCEPRTVPQIARL